MLYHISLLILFTIIVIEQSNSLYVKFTRSASTPGKFTNIPSIYNNTFNLLLLGVKDISRAKCYSTNMNLKQAFRILSVSSTITQPLQI